MDFDSYFCSRKYHMLLNRVLLVCLFALMMPVCARAQKTDSSAVQKDSSGITGTNRNADSSIAAVKDSADSLVKKPVASVISKQGKSLDSLLAENAYLNSTGKPVAFLQSPRRSSPKDIIFYALVSIVLFFAILKVIYPRYFTNLFRVFFNTSLRQSQLTDQLLQAKLTSLFYNIFFILTASWYIYMLLSHAGMITGDMHWSILLICAAGLTVIYIGKFSILKFTGWITGYRQEADTYIFIIFLINKIVAICLVPLIIIIAFSDKELVNIAIFVSYIVVAAMVLMRFFRSYGLLQNRLKVSRLHFLLYIVGIEIVPILVVYKLALLFLNKSS